MDDGDFVVHQDQSMKSFEVLEVILLDLSDLVVLQVQQGGVVRDVPGNGFQTEVRALDHTQVALASEGAAGSDRSMR